MDFKSEDVVKMNIDELIRNFFYINTEDKRREYKCYMLGPDKKNCRYRFWGKRIAQKARRHAKKHIHSLNYDLGNIQGKPNGYYILFDGSFAPGKSL